MKKPHIWFDDCLWVCARGKHDWAEEWGKTPLDAYRLHIRRLSHV